VGRYFKEVWDSLRIFALSGAALFAVALLISYLRCGGFDAGCAQSWLDGNGKWETPIRSAVLALFAASFAFAGLEMAENASGLLQKLLWIALGLVLAGVMWFFFSAAYLALIGATLH